MPEHTGIPPETTPFSCGVEAVWYVEYRLFEDGAPREALREALGVPEKGANVSLLQIKQYLEDSRGLYVKGVEAPLSRLDACLDRMLCIVHCEGKQSPAGHLIALEKDGRDYVVSDMGRVVTLPALSGEREQLDALSSSREMSGATLLVSKEPIELPRPGAAFVGVAGMLMVLIVAGVVWRKWRSLGRRQKEAAATALPETEQ